MASAFSRRAFLKGTVALALGLRNLRLTLPSSANAETGGSAEPVYGDWQDVYRQKWRWDKVVKGTHHWANCASACAWDLFVKDGIVWREEQAAVYSQTNPELPDFNPRGCQKGAYTSGLAASSSRITHPLRRTGARGSGKWRRISWREALTEIADEIIDVCLKDGPQAITWDFGNIDFGPSSAAQMRLFALLGVPMLDALAGTGDLPIGAIQTWGFSNSDGTADDWFHSDFIFVWSMNPSYTRIPDAHFLWEARYRGATIASVAPDYNATSIHADYWLNPRVGTDAALALAMAGVIVREGLYKKEYVKEQTDLPFLVREDTGRFLRENDLKKNGKEDIFYLWDTEKKRPVQAPGTEGHSDATLRLGAIDPALEGTYSVELAEGGSVSVRPVFARLMDRLAAYTPAKAAEITGVGADLIEQVARAVARSRAAMILASYGSCKHYHSDLLQRSMILLLALTGNQGKRGTGLRLAAFWSMSGFEWLASAYEPSFLQRLVLHFYRPPAKVVEDHMKEAVWKDFPFVPLIPWLWAHGGYSKFHKAPDLDAAIEEAQSKRWMPNFLKPGQEPRVFFATGANILRRLPVPQVVEKELWPKLRLIVAVDFRLSSTAHKADIFLPAAGYYEKRGIKYAQSYLPYVIFGDKAVEPPGEAKGEWEIYGLLARIIERRAKQRGIGPYHDAVGGERDLSKIYEKWSAGGKFTWKDDREALRYIMDKSSAVVDCSWEEAVQKGAVKIRGTGMYGPGTAICSDFEPGQTVYPSQWFVEKKEPWPTLTGRQQFFLDHPWFLEAGEDLPCFKDPPLIGGNYPLRLTGGHTRWSIHAIWRYEENLLRLQRGEPVLFINPGDARRRGIVDHDLVRIYNDAGNSSARVKVTAAVQPGQVVMYHAWEPSQFKGWRSIQETIPTPFKPTHLIGDYGHLRYRMYYSSPAYSPRGTTVEVVKADSVSG